MVLHFIIIFINIAVIAVDIDPVKIELARHNAKVYGVEDRIEFIVGDFMKLAPKLAADVVFLSPPWGGPEYFSNKEYNLDQIEIKGGGEEIYKLATGITTNICYYLPKNINTDQVNLTFFLCVQTLLTLV